MVKMVTFMYTFYKIKHTSFKVILSAAGNYMTLSKSCNLSNTFSSSVKQE